MRNPVPILSDKVYDTLKYVAQIVLPALGAGYFAIAQIWGFPGGEKVVGTIVVLDTFLGAILNLSSKAYNESDEKFDGSIEQQTLNVDLEPKANLAEKDEVVLKVEEPKPSPRKRPAKKATKRVP